ncbi:hypothetical protein ACFE04_021226 [Oxalis oulophora]
MELDYLEDSDQRNSRKAKWFPQESLPKLRHCNSSNSQNRRLQVPYFAEKAYIVIRKNEMHVQNYDKTLLEGLGCKWNLYIDFQSKMKHDLDTLSILAGEFQEALRAIKCFLNVTKKERMKDCCLTGRRDTRDDIRRSARRGDCRGRRTYDGSDDPAKQLVIHR